AAAALMLVVGLIAVAARGRGARIRRSRSVLSNGHRLRRMSMGRPLPIRPSAAAVEGPVACSAFSATSRSIESTKSYAASLGSTPHRKDLRQLVRGDDLELGVCAVGRLLVVAPAPKLRRVAEPRALHVFVGDLDDELGP